MAHTYTSVNYSELNKHVSEESGSVYVVAHDILPSQYRSLKLFPTPTRDSGTGSSTNPKSRLSTRCVYVILASIFVTSVVFAAIISIFEIRKFANQPEAMLGYMGNVTDGGMAMLLTNNTGEDPDVSINIVGQEERTPCISACRAYSAPKFQSRCQSGYCVCEGQGYQSQTCLPIANLCTIHKSMNGSAKAYIRNTPQPVYTCRTETQSLTETHVISIYGNHFAKQTIVNVSGAKEAPISFVLASHYPVHWKLKTNDLEIDSIVIVSDRNPDLSTVDISGSVGNRVILPDLRHVTMFVGYGDDQHNSNTTEMLRTLTNKVETIKSFTGAAFADYFCIKLTT